MAKKGRSGDRPKVTKGLKGIFADLHDHLYTQSNISRNERLGRELLKIIMAKYFDEKMGAGVFPKDRVEVLKTAFPRRFREFFNGTLSPRLVNAGIYTKKEPIALDDRSLSFVGQVLAGLDFADSSMDILGSAFEVFAEGGLAGDKGQFFTPQARVSMAVAMLDPGPMDNVIDPACGSGGFLNQTARWASNKKGKGVKGDDRFERFLRMNIYGIEKDADLVEIARGISLVTGRSPDNVLHMDTLELFRGDPDELLGTFDIVLTNPPFGSKIKVTDEDLLRRFDLGHRWVLDEETGRWERTKRVQEREPQILFIEICMALLKEGGRCAIVLPDGLFGNPTDGWVRQFILERAEVLAVVDCPHDTFMPATHTKTSVLFFQKRQRPRDEYQLFMSIVDRCGHDSRGGVISDDEGVVDEEFSEVPGRYKAFMTGDPKRRKVDRLGFVVRRRSLVENILVPGHYDPDLKREISNLERSGKFDLLSIDDLEERGVLEIRNAPATASKLQYGTGEVPFIRTSDIGNGEVLYPTTHSVSRRVYERYSGKQDLRPGDILIIKDGTYKVGRSIILLEQDVEALVQSHFKVIRVKRNDLLDAFLLYHLLQQPIVMKQIALNTFVQATLSTIGKRFGKVVLPIPREKKERRKVSKEVEDRLRARRRLLTELREIK